MTDRELELQVHGSALLMPFLTVRDVSRSLAFYEQAFDFEPGNTLADPDGTIAYADMTYHGRTLIMMGPEDGRSQAPAPDGRPPPVALYLYVPDVDEVFTLSLRAGAKPVSEPQDMFWGDRMAELRDPDGHAWSIATRLESGEGEGMDDSFYLP